MNDEFGHSSFIVHRSSLDLHGSQPGRGERENMPTTINKQRVLNQLLAAQKGAEPPAPEPLPVLEQFVYAVCREGATREQADRAFRRLKDDFYDWNEVRVSSTREIEEALEEL